MKVINRVLMVIGKALIHLVTAINAYLVAVVITGSLLSVVMAGMSVFNKMLPLMFYTEYWKYLALFSIPVSIILFAYVEIKVNILKG